MPFGSRNGIQVFNQQSFLAYINTSLTNQTGDGTLVNLSYDTVFYNNGTVFGSGTTFTAPVTGLYRIGASLLLSNLGAGHTSVTFVLGNSTTLNQVYLASCNPGAGRTAGNLFLASGCLDLQMTAGNIANLSVLVAGSTKTVGLTGFDTGNLGNYFYATLLTTG